MLITRISMFSGNENTLDLPITEEQLTRWERGDILIQNAFPNLTPDQREFVKTGILSKEWDEMFSSTEEE